MMMHSFCPTSGKTVAHLQIVEDCTGAPDAACSPIQSSRGPEAIREYEAAYQGFSIEALEHRVLQGRLADGLNACIECCDRWASDGRVALEWIGKDFARQTLTFSELQKAASRFANLLRSRGIAQGDTVAAVLPRTPELVAVILGIDCPPILQNGTVGRWRVCCHSRRSGGHIRSGDEPRRRPFHRNLHLRAHR
jgi:hypothetical protein